MTENYDQPDATQPTTYVDIAQEAIDAAAALTEARQRVDRLTGTLLAKANAEVEAASGRFRAATIQLEQANANIAEGVRA